jgi:hypothetical protein
MTKRVPNGIWQSKTDKMAERKGEGEEKKDPPCMADAY